jgi:DNA repair ATPase RecN
MTTEDKQQIHTRGSKEGRRFHLSPLVIAMILGGVLLLVGLLIDRPNFYAPGRSVLTKAEMRLAETYSEEKLLVDKLHKMRSNLDNVIELLGQAEQLDPSDKAVIEALRKRLRALENPERLTDTTPEALHQAYKEMMTELSQLTRKLQKS